MNIEVSTGEILDKLSILSIKLQRIKQKNRSKKLNGCYQICLLKN
jgi:hypothetical protein